MPKAMKRTSRRTPVLARAAGGRANGRGRAARVERRTKETAIELALTVDGRGRYDVQTGVPFLNHMLEQLRPPRLLRSHRARHAATSRWMSITPSRTSG